MIVKIDVLLDVWWSQPMIGIVVYIVANYFEKKIINYSLLTDIYNCFTSSDTAILFIFYITYNFASVDDILVCPLDNLETPSDIQLLTSPLKILKLEQILGNMINYMIYILSCMYVYLHYRILYCLVWMYNHTSS